MTSKQRAHYFSHLWPAACQAQGWSVQDEAMRRDVTFECTGSSSSSGLSQEQITALFRFLEYLADPLNLSKAILHANPEVAEEENRRRQLIHVVEKLQFEDTYIARCADGLCASEGREHWIDLPSTALLKLSFRLKTRARQRDADQGQRDNFVPRVVPYHQRPETKLKRAAAREPQVVPRPGAQISADLLPF